MNSKKKPDKKCAPGKSYNNGSCLSLPSLVNIAKKYNLKNKNNPIDINKSKHELVTELENKLSSKCSEQTCWLRLDVVKEIEDENIKNDILKYSFRPKGPEDKYGWISTTHINEVVDQYQNVHTNFEFLGAVPYDFEDLPILGLSNINFFEKLKNGKSKLGIVINLDEHNKSGSHWVALYTDLLKNQVYFFDSVGRSPLKRIRKFINKIVKFLYFKNFRTKLEINDALGQLRSLKTMQKSRKLKLLKDNEQLSNLQKFDIRHNHIQHQFDNSECGVYSINFIIRLVDGERTGETFDSIINNITKDESMNENRKIYFRNVN